MMTITMTMRMAIKRTKNIVTLLVGEDEDEVVW